MGLPAACVKVPSPLRSRTVTEPSRALVRLKRFPFWPKSPFWKLPAKHLRQPWLHQYARAQDWANHSLDENVQKHSDWVCDMPKIGPFTRIATRPSDQHRSLSLPVRQSLSAAPPNIDVVTNSAPPPIRRGRLNPVRRASVPPIERPRLGPSSTLVRALTFDDFSPTPTTGSRLVVNRSHFESRWVSRICLFRRAFRARICVIRLSQTSPT